jgi:hypothetical protein
MPKQDVHQCRCPICSRSKNHADRELHRQFNLLLSRLDEQQRRWMVALESKKIGHGGDRFMAAVSGLSVETIRRGRQELDDDLAGRPTDRVRLPGAGQPLIEKNSRSPPAAEPLGRRRDRRRADWCETIRA